MKKLFFTLTIFSLVLLSFSCKNDQKQKEEMKAVEMEVQKNDSITNSLEKQKEVIDKTAEDLDKAIEEL